MSHDPYSATRADREEPHPESSGLPAPSVPASLVAVAVDIPGQPIALAVIDPATGVTRADLGLPGWDAFRHASAGHRLIEHGYMIRPDARRNGQNGWVKVPRIGWAVPVVSTDDVL